jgi:hypothetical protein
MGETANIGEIADKLSEDIFKYFGWETHPLRNENFQCSDSTHLVKVKPGKKEKKPEAPRQKEAHPGDVLFSYADPYLGIKVYLHTDLKSYGKTSISSIKLRSALESLSMTVECARNSSHWRKKYSINEDQAIDVRGLLFVHNHDGKFKQSFLTAIEGTNFATIPIAPNVYIHFIGPEDVDRLFTIANDIMRLQNKNLLPKSYSCYYPDLVMWRRQGDVFAQPATIEALTAPYFVLTYEQGTKLPPGFVIYYNRNGANPEEFEYFLDSLSQWQMLEPGKFIRIQVISRSPHENLLSNFRAAKEKYARAWGFDQARVQVLDDIKIDVVSAMVSTYSAPAIGWREH